MLKRNLFFLFSITIFAFASLILDLFNYDPFEAKTAIFVNFYVSSLFTLAGILASILYYTRIRFSGDKTIYASFWPSVRQSFFASATIVILLILQGLRLLDWWVGGSVVIIAILFELFFQTKKPSIKLKHQLQKG